MYWDLICELVMIHVFLCLTGSVTTKTTGDDDSTKDGEDEKQNKNKTTKENSKKNNINSESKPLFFSQIDIFFHL